MERELFLYFSWYNGHRPRSRLGATTPDEIYYHQFRAGTGDGPIGPHSSVTRSGELQDWAQAARLVGVTRARMTQIANLLLLAPKIQEGILNLSHVTRGQDPVTERSLREVAAQADWQIQEVPWLTSKR